MNKFNAILALLTIVAISSCKQYSIEKEVKDWIPYSKGQVLLFKSNLGKIDTIKITGIERFNSPEDNLAIISPMHEKLVVNARIPTDFIAPNGRQVRTIPHTILVIDANTNSTTIDLIFRPYDYYFESTGHEIQKLKRESIYLGSKLFNDVILFKCNNDFFCTKENSINEIIWSDKYGIIYYKLGDEEFNLII